MARFLRACLLVGLEGAGRREGAGELLAEPLLLLRQRLQAGLQIARHEALDAGAVEANELPQEGDGQQRLAALLALLVDDDLGQHGVGQVVAGLGVEDDEIALAFHHRGQIVERDVGARLGIVEAPVGVFLDDNRFLLVRRRVSFVEHERCVDCWSRWSISVHNASTFAPAKASRLLERWFGSSVTSGCMHLAKAAGIASRIRCRREPGFAIVAQRCARIFPRCIRRQCAGCRASRTLLGDQDEQGSSHHRHRRRRAYAGRLVQRRAGEPAGARARQGCHQGGARAGARGDGRRVRGHHGPDPGRRHGPEPGAAGLHRRRHSRSTRRPGA